MDPGPPVSDHSIKPSSASTESSVEVHGGNPVGPGAVRVVAIFDATDVERLATGPCADIQSDQRNRVISACFDCIDDFEMMDEKVVDLVQFLIEAESEIAVEVQVLEQLAGIAQLLANGIFR